MTKRKSTFVLPVPRAVSQASVKSTITSPLPSHPDVKKDDLSTLLMGTDPVEEYNKETNFFVRRQLVWSTYKRCTATAALAHSAASEIAAQEIMITPTEANPSATTIMRAKYAIDLINSAMNRPGGIVDFIVNIVDGYWGSKTGAFILTPRDVHGNILSLGIIPPMLPRPYYGWDNNTPVLSPSMSSAVIADGIWFSELSLTGGSYYTLPFDSYWQLCYGSYAYGAWQDGEPIAEKQLSNIVTHIVLSDYVRRTITCTDDAQVVLWNNVDAVALQKRSTEQKLLAYRRRQNLPVNPEDEGTRLHVTERDPDRPADVKAVNLRAFPDGFDPEMQMNNFEQRIALGFGLHPRRIAGDVQKERFGNASQAAMLNSDEPGIKVLKSVIQYFINSVLLDGVPLRAEFNSRSSPENYAIVQRDQVVSQVISQLGDKITPEMAQAYLVRNGVLTPSDIGIDSLRASDGVPLGMGWISLRDRFGHLLTYNNVLELAATTKKAVDPLLEPCAQKAIERWTEWTVNELPTVIEPTGVSYYGLRQEVDDITIEVYHDLIQCSKSKGGRSNDSRVRTIYDAFMAFFYNMFGSPGLRRFSDQKPKSNMFDELWAVSLLFYTIGAAEAGKRMQTIATRYTSVLSRYANATRAVVYMSEGLKNMSAPVTWVLGVTENHCNMCPQFAGHYPSFEEMIRHTGGLLPGDVRLTCSGNCKCRLEY